MNCDVSKLAGDIDTLIANTAEEVTKGVRNGYGASDDGVGYLIDALRSLRTARGSLEMVKWARDKSQVNSK